MLCATAGAFVRSYPSESSMLHRGEPRRFADNLLDVIVVWMQVVELMQ